MEYEVKQIAARKIAGFHMVGPWEQTVKQGFEQLMMWVDGQQIPAREWLAVYYDNPDEVPAEKLRCDTVVSVDDDFVIPPNSEGVMMAEVAGGLYAVARARVIDHDFSTPWYQFFDSVLKDETHRLAAKPCFEIYRNNGAEDGYWDIEMFVALEPKG
ncbi:TPA: DNA gyrase inhibitor SbmC [Kluyvera georgiana]|uniref:DNA gyrase inhibitor n=1 Tax=Kluyvera georgiana ATCC 51603 TaxID=1354264 RepID=A0A1B7JIG0_9ENTR|nr:DNA gyrase inhibitor SbmC [Kluyvera georgiana]MDA8492935.1 DNA gyrase inhibitor SbmC [Kluyvera georgiana]OAT47678.1 DNA gyrase inhibitory protein [Kluyvera georgiana ATCC 51603]HDG1691506.1 DNA gyrase inhibitor SbmC [Kluyvera georgiana]